MLKKNGAKIGGKSYFSPCDTDAGFSGWVTRQILFLTPSVWCDDKSICYNNICKREASSIDEKITVQINLFSYQIFSEHVLNA